MVQRSRQLPLFSGEFLYPLLVVLAIGLTALVATRIVSNQRLSGRDALVISGVSTGVGTTTLLLVGGFIGAQKPRYVELYQSICRLPRAPH